MNSTQGKSRWKLNFLDLAKIKQKDELKKKKQKNFYPKVKQV
jgi:hypothetical protein